MRTLILIIILLFTSCKTIILSTVGRYYMNHMFNKGTIDLKTFYTEIPYEIDGNSIYLIVKQKKIKQEVSISF